MDGDSRRSLKLGGGLGISLAYPRVPVEAEQHFRSTERYTTAAVFLTVSSGCWLWALRGQPRRNLPHPTSARAQLLEPQDYQAHAALACSISVSLCARRS